MPGIHERSRGTGPRATGKKTPPLHVGRGPVPRHAWDARTIAGDRPPRYGEKTPPLYVGRARTIKVDKYRNGVMKHPLLIPTKPREDGEYQRRDRNAARGDDATDFPPFTVSLLIAHVGEDVIKFHLQARQVAT